MKLLQDGSDRLSVELNIDKILKGIRKNKIVVIISYQHYFNDLLLLFKRKNHKKKQYVIFLNN